MGLAFTPERHETTKIGDRYGIRYGTIDLTGIYPRGGYAEPTNMQLQNWFQDLKLVTFENTGGYLLDYDRTNKKVKVFFGANLEAPNLAAIVVSDIYMRAEGWM